MNKSLVLTPTTIAKHSGIAQLHGHQTTISLEQYNKDDIFETISFDELDFMQFTEDDNSVIDL